MHSGLGYGLTRSSPRPGGEQGLRATGGQAVGNSCIHFDRPVDLRHARRRPSIGSPSPPLALIRPAASERAHRYGGSVPGNVSAFRMGCQAVVGSMLAMPHEQGDFTDMRAFRIAHWGSLINIGIAIKCGRTQLRVRPAIVRPASDIPLRRSSARAGRGKCCDGFAAAAPQRVGTPASGLPRTSVPRGNGLRRSSRPRA